MQDILVQGGSSEDARAAYLEYLVYNSRRNECIH